MLKDLIVFVLSFGPWVVLDLYLHALLMLDI